MNIAEFSRIQRHLGLSDREFGLAIGFSEKSAARTVRGLKEGRAKITPMNEKVVLELLRRHLRQGCQDEWIFGYNVTGYREYVVHTHKPAFIATINSRYQFDAINWIDEMPDDKTMRRLEAEFRIADSKRRWRA